MDFAFEIFGFSPKARDNFEGASEGTKAFPFFFSFSDHPSDTIPQHFEIGLALPRRFFDYLVFRHSQSHNANYFFLLRIE